MKVIVAGSRRGIYAQYVYDKLDEILGNLAKRDQLVILSGTARGVDRMGEGWAQDKGVQVERHPAQWDLHGRRAGYIRNDLMAQEADALVAIWDGQSRGTKHMIDIARHYGLQVRIVRADLDGAVEQGEGC